MQSVGTVFQVTDLKALQRTQDGGHLLNQCWNCGVAFSLEGGIDALYCCMCGKPLEIPDPQDMTECPLCHEILDGKKQHGSWCK